MNILDLLSEKHIYDMESVLNEDWRSILAGAGLASILATSGIAADKNVKPSVSSKESSGVLSQLNSFVSPSNMKGDIVDILKKLENDKNYAPGKFNKKTQKWEIYSDQGKPAVAYGHNLSPSEIKVVETNNGITDEQATELLKRDIESKTAMVKKFIPSYGSLPIEVKNAVIVAAFRGDILAKHKTTELINNGDFKSAAVEFLDNQNFRTGNAGVKKRMLIVAKALSDAGKGSSIKEIDMADKFKLPPQDDSVQARKVLVFTMILKQLIDHILRRDDRAFPPTAKKLYTLFSELTIIKRDVPHQYDVVLGILDSIQKFNTTQGFDKLIPYIDMLNLNLDKMIDG